MNTTPQLLSPANKSDQLSPNVFSPHIDASILLRRRSSFQFKFLSKVNEFRDAIRQAITFEKAASPTIPTANKQHDHGHVDNIIIKVDKAEEAYLQENTNTQSTRKRTFADKWTQTEDKYFEISLKEPPEFSKSAPSRTPMSASKRKISVNSVTRHSAKDLSSTFEDKKSEIHNETFSFEKQIDIEALDSSFFDENGIIDARYISINGNEIAMSDSVKSFLENERKAEEVSQDNRRVDAGKYSSHENEGESRRGNGGENVDEVLKGGTSLRRRISFDRFMAIDVMNSTEMSLSRETEDEPLESSMYYSSMPEHILEQSCRINTPPFAKPKRSTSSPKFQDSGYEHQSSSVLSGEAKSILDNSFDLETEEKDVELEKKRMMILSKEAGGNQAYEY